MRSKEDDRVGLPPVNDAAAASSARVHDYLLGGKDNFQADRDVAARLLTLYPRSRETVAQSRGFLIRAVRYLACEAGIRRFLDIGAGLPTQNNVHQVAQEHAPDSRIVYVDNDPMVLVHARALLACDTGVEVAEGDVRAPDRILNAPAVRLLLEPREPVALLMVGLLEFIADCEQARRAVATLLAALPSGSYLVITHSVDDARYRDVIHQAQHAYASATVAFVTRPREQIVRFLDGLQVLSPGVVQVSRWRPDTISRPCPATAAAVARKP
ncbi:SAM-dependent methyltransferase [Actinomadura rugatobispora]|uniref:SAM-dependent methyltransferase n=1 Tax=Actinomadura rugatobispora TaxID=1994 RepID=A0ABW0ZPV4_9ACTN|nr:SAM-dependent methyltransferase [Actinomadura rugatobispora]